MHIRTLTAGVATTAVVLGSGAAFTPGSSVADTGCPSLYVVAVPGTWETGKDRTTEGEGMLGGVTDGLPASAQVAYVDYDASAFPWEGAIYGVSRADAVDKARTLIGNMARTCSETRFALVGYSQGADAAGDLAADISRGGDVVEPNRIAAVGLISDPQRSPGDTQIGPRTGGAGAEGPRPGGFGPLTDSVRTICAVGDLYCSTDDNDFVMRFAGYLNSHSGDPQLDPWQARLEATALLSDLHAGHGIDGLEQQFGSDISRQQAEQLAHFYATGTHESYGTYQVADGTTAVGWMHDWLAGLS